MVQVQEFRGLQRPRAGPFKCIRFDNSDARFAGWPVCGRDAKVPDFGPFNRRETDIQTPELAKEQVATGEVWGLTPSNGGMEPTVQAYTGRLKPPHKRGIEFTTDILPHPNASPLEVRWYMTKTPGVQRRYKDGKEFACITAVVRNLQP